MSIIAYTGLPGSGKSYGVVENVIIPALKSGRHVVHNMPLNESDLLGFCGAGQLTKLPDNTGPKELVDLVPAGAYLIADEFWRFWPSGLRDNAIPENQKEFFAMHRHKVDADGNSMEVVIVCQDLSQIAAFIRSLVEQTFRSSRLTSIGSRNRYRIDIYEGAVTGQKPPVTKRVREIFGKYKPEVYKFYRSHTLSEGDKAGSESKADTRANLLKGGRMKVTFVVLALIPVLIYFAVHSLFAFKNQVSHNAEEKSARQQVQSTTMQSVSTALPQPVESITWRLVGRIVLDNVIYFLADSDGGSRRIPIKDCDRNEDGLNWRCHLHGEIITEWSGPPPPVFNQFFTASASHNLN